MHVEHHPGSYEIVHIKDSAGHSFATRLTNIFIIGEGKKPLITLPKLGGLRQSLLEERASKIRQYEREEEEDEEDDEWAQPWSDLPNLQSEWKPLVEVSGFKGQSGISWSLNLPRALIRAEWLSKVQTFKLSLLFNLLFRVASI